MTLHPCAACGKKQPADHMVYSRHSGNRYCGDVDACRKRRPKKEKA